MLEREQPEKEKHPAGDEQLQQPHPLEVEGASVSAPQITSSAVIHGKMTPPGVVEAESKLERSERRGPILQRVVAGVVLLLLLGAGYRAGGFVQKTTVGHSTMVVRRLLGNRSHMIAMNPDSQDEELGMDGEAFPQTLDSYWGVVNNVTNHFYNPTPLSLFTPTGRSILSSPKSLRTHLTYSAIQGVLSSLTDPYTRFLDPAAYKEMQQDNAGSFAGIGAQLVDKNGKIVIVKPLPDTPAAEAHIMPMDEIAAINGHLTDKMTSENAVQLIRGKPGTTVVLTLRRAGKLITVRLVRAVINSEHFEFRMIDGTIGYMHLMMFDELAADNIERALQSFSQQGAKSIILDLRDNPGGLLNAAVDVSSKFIPPGPVVWVQERGGQRNALMTNSDSKNKHHLPLVVLVNHYSASASEIVSGAIKDTHAGTVMGVTTWGKGLVQEVIPLNDNSAIALTIERYYTPSGTDINQKGVTPDVVVGHKMAEPDSPSQAEIEEWIKQKDAIDKSQLDAAVSFLHKETNTPAQVALNPSPSFNGKSQP